MKKELLILVFGVCFLLPMTAKGWFLLNNAHHPKYARLQTGDIVFQDTGGHQGKAVTAATGSNLTHVGVILEKEGRLYVFEAVQPVQIIPLEAWKVRSKIFHARRLIDHRLFDNDAFLRAVSWGQKQLGKKYDFKFRWSDDEMYCSELVWKIYREAIRRPLCTPRTFDSYNLEDQNTLRIILQRYGTLAHLPKKELCVAPSDLAKSSLLAEVPHTKRKKKSPR